MKHIKLLPKFWQICHFLYCYRHFQQIYLFCILQIKANLKRLLCQVEMKQEIAMKSQFQLSKNNKIFPYLLLFTVLFRSLVGVSHHPALFSLSSPLPSLLAGPHTSPKFILLFSSFSPFSVQTSHETPKSILDPMHPRWQRLLSPRKEEGKCFHLHLYYKKRLLSVHVLRSQILLVQWCVQDATFSPKLLWVVGGCHDEI